MNVISIERPYTNKMPVAKQCAVCGRMFANKSNLNRHCANMHMNKNKNKRKKNLRKGDQLTKYVVADVTLKKKKKITKHGLHIQTLNKILWDIVLHLIKTKQLTIGQTSRRKLSSL